MIVALDDLLLVPKLAFRGVLAVLDAPMVIVALE